MGVDDQNVGTGIGNGSFKRPAVIVFKTFTVYRAHFQTVASDTTFFRSVAELDVFSVSVLGDGDSLFFENGVALEQFDLGLFTTIAIKL